MTTVEQIVTHLESLRQPGESYEDFSRRVGLKTGGLYRFMKDKPAPTPATLQALGQFARRERAESLLNDLARYALGLPDAEVVLPDGF